MVENSSVWAAVRRQEEMAAMPAGFFAFQSISGKTFDIYFKSTVQSKPTTIQFSLTEKKAKAKAELLNSILATK